LDDEVKLGLDSVTDMFAKNDMGLGLYTPVQYCIIPGQGMNLLQQYQPWLLTGWHGPKSSTCMH